jgi:hypothetical protein
MFDDIPDPKKLEEFNLHSGVKTLGILIKKLYTSINKFINIQFYIFNI